jgi:hypothetical protein
MHLSACHPLVLLTLPIYWHRLVQSLAQHVSWSSLGMCCPFHPMAALPGTLSGSAGSSFEDGIRDCQLMSQGPLSTAGPTVHTASAKQVENPALLS